MDEPTALAGLLKDLQAIINKSAFQLAISAEVDWSQFNKVLHGQENRTLAPEHIDALVEDLVGKKLLPAEAAPDWKEWLHAAALTDKTMASVVERRNPEADREEFIKTRKGLMKFWRERWRQSGGQIGVFIPLAEASFNEAYRLVPAALKPPKVHVQEPEARPKQTVQDKTEEKTREVKQTRPVEPKPQEKPPDPERARETQNLAFSVPELVRITAGSFWMGTSPDEIDLLCRMAETREWAMRLKRGGWLKNEQAQHRVWLDEYRIAKYPVTNWEYLIFVRETRHRAPEGWDAWGYPNGKGMHPIKKVDWEDANAFCAWMNERLRKAGALTEGRVIRPPTEAEWEKAAAWDEARQHHRLYPWGDFWDASRLNARDKVRDRTPVNQYLPAGDSAFGVSDMAGNVDEWCVDWYEEGYYGHAPDKNPCGPASGTYRVLRGGSWLYDHYDARCAFRGWGNPDYRHYNVGFRVVESSPVRTF